MGSVWQLAAQYDFDKRIKVGGENFNGTIAQCRNGFIWIGSSTGLHRYDGKNFFHYRHDPQDPQSLQTNSVTTILPVEDEIWAGTAQGISVLDTRNQKFRHYRIPDQPGSRLSGKDAIVDVIALFRDRQGEIWIGTGNSGVWKYDPSSDQFINYNLDKYPPLTPSIYSPLKVSSLEQSLTNDSIIWAGTDAGLLEINKYSGKKEQFIYPLSDKNLQTSVNIFRRIHHHTDGLLYVGHWNGGIHVFDPVTRKLSPLPVINDPEDVLSRVGMSSILTSRSGQLWFSTSSGLFLYSPKEKKIVFRKENDNEKNEIYGLSIIDDHDRLWYSGYQGLFLYDPNEERFMNYSFEQLLPSDLGGMAFQIRSTSEPATIVVCPRITDRLLYFNRNTHRWTESKFENLEKYTGRRQGLDVYGFTPIGNGEYMLSGLNGVFRFNERTHLLTPFLEQKPDQISQWTYSCLDSSRQVWIGTRGYGLYMVNPYTGSFQVFNQELQGRNGQSVSVNTIYADSRNNMWIERNGGFSVYIRSTGRILNFIFEDNSSNTFNSVRDFCEDREGKIWIISREGWLGYALLDHPEKGIVKKMNLLSFGLEGNIEGIIGDGFGGILGITYNDVLQINAADSIISLYKIRNSGITLEYFGMHLTPDRQLIVGGRKKITSFYPEKLKETRIPPVPYISRITIKQKPYTSPYPVFGGKELKFANNENFFSITYAAQSFSYGGDVQYRYRLKDFEDWVDAGENQTANYTNVPPGHYVFQLMATHNGKIWNNKILEIPITVAQAWYKSWWFLTLLFLFVGALIYSFYNYRINQIRNEERLKSAYEKKLAGVEMSALVAQMNPHFLFNSLNSIDSYIIKNETEKASAYLNNFASLMRLILQNSRSSLVSLQDELEGLEFYLQMESYRFENRFRYEINIAEDIKPEQIEIPPMLIQPYVENAVWHGIMHLDENQQGMVLLEIWKKDQQLIISVTDNGIGRVKSAALKSKKSAHKQHMGMEITERRIEMINKLYNTGASVKITDLYDADGNAGGTRVVIIISI